MNMPCSSFLLTFGILHQRTGGEEGGDGWRRGRTGREEAGRTGREEKGRTGREEGGRVEKRKGGRVEKREETGREER